jgi:hypothetical protein
MSDLPPETPNVAIRNFVVARWCGLGAESKPEAAQDWELNLGGVRTYLYPLHGSGGFVTATGLAATLQMFTLRFLAGQYTDAFRLVPACFTDQPFSPEEEQLFKQYAPTLSRLLPPLYSP